MASIPTRQGTVITYMQCLKNKMQENGWCPHQSDYFARLYDYGIFSYFADLKPLEEPHQHKVCERKPFCVAYNVDWREYKTRHVRADCICNTIRVPYDKLLDVLRSGDTPLVSIETPDDASLEAGQGLHLQVHGVRSGSTERNYVAISHV
jgi:hypothetical protein